MNNAVHAIYLGKLHEQRLDISTVYTCYLKLITGPEAGVFTRVVDGTVVAT